MKKYFIILGIIIVSAIILGAWFLWNSPTGETESNIAPAAEDNFSTQSVLGLWQVTLAGSSGDHILRFEFATDSAVTFTQEYVDDDPTVDTGTWEINATDKTVLLNLPIQTMVFQLQEDDILKLTTYDVSIWGQQGFTLRRAQ